MNGNDVNVPTKTAIAAPTNPKCKISGTIGIINPNRLTSVITVIYSCLPTAKNNADVDPETALVTPKIARIGSTDAAANHFSPNTKVIICFGNKNNKIPKGNVNKNINTVVFTKAANKRFLSPAIFVNTGKVTREKTSAISVIGRMEREYAI